MRLKLRNEVISIFIGAYEYLYGIVALNRKPKASTLLRNGLGFRVSGLLGLEVRGGALGSRAQALASDSQVSRLVHQFEAPPMY